jgi:hypothetical protein
MDHHVHAAITDGLRRRDVEVITAQGDGAARVDDERLLERATQLGCVLFSQDKDLLILTHRWLQTGREFAGLVYAHQLSVTIGQAVRDLELIAKALDPQDMRNRIEFIPL